MRHKRSHTKVIATIGPAIRNMQMIIDSTETEEFLVASNFLKKGDLVVHVGSIPIVDRGKTNMMKLTRVT